MRPQRFAVVVAALSGMVACSSSPTASAGNPLSGLNQVSVSVKDTATAAQGAVAPGSFHGSVLGYMNGPDSVDVPLANVLVVAYARVNGVTSASLTAETHSDANGLWALPTLAAGEYAVTYDPGAASAYRAGYTIATTQAVSAAWTVMLPAK